MAKPAVIKFEYRFNTGGGTGEIAISPTFFKTSAVLLGEDNRCVGPLPRVRSPSSSLVVSRGTSLRLSTNYSI